MTTPIIGPHGLPQWDKDPSAIKDYVFDWSLWLDGDTIVTSTWLLPAGLTLQDEAKSTTTTTVWVSGGQVGRRYVVTNRITTVGGRIDDRSFELVVKEL